MSHETIVILGIPVDNLTMDKTVETIFHMIDDYGVDGRARQVATVNVDFVVNTLTWRLKNIRHPELIDILRRADLVTADGMPIVWASKLLGSPLQERVTGADLVPGLAEEAAKRGKSLFLLGGRGDVGQKAADILKERYPDLKIADVYSPFVHVEGEAIAEAEEADESIVERINRSGADILLIGFGNPKQEVWFDRNRDKLAVPVSIGIGGTYEFIVGSVTRAPEWMQRTGLEWLFRITQDPKRLIKRYFMGLLKFGVMIWPAIFYYRYRKFLHKLTLPKQRVPGEPDVSIEQVSTGYLKVIQLPERVDAPFLERNRERLKDEIKQAPNIVLDLNRTTFLDSSGLGFVTTARSGAIKEGKDLYLSGVKPLLINFFKLSRVWDLFSNSSFESLPEVLRILKEKSSATAFYFVIQTEPGHHLVSLFGRLDAAQMQHLDVDAIANDIGDKNCILDLEGLDFVDSSGVAFFIRIQRHFAKQGRVCVLCGLGRNVRQMFRMIKVLPLFLVASDMAGAKKKLEKS